MFYLPDSIVQLDNRRLLLGWLLQVLCFLLDDWFLAFSLDKSPLPKQSCVDLKRDETEVLTLEPVVLESDVVAAFMGAVERDGKFDFVHWIFDHIERLLSKNSSYLLFGRHNII
jgi:hypothetical protein